MTILHTLKNNLDLNVKFPSVSLSLNTDGYQPMGYNKSSWESSRIVEFYILESLHDFNPFIIKCGCHTIWLLILLLYLILVPVRVRNQMSCPEIVWALQCLHHFFNKNKCLTLTKNPHFYANLPTLLKAHGCMAKIDPTEDFQQGDTFYVLTDRQEPVHVITGNKVLHFFGNLWHYENTVIFKGSGNLVFPPLFLTSWQIFVEGLWGKALSRHLLEAHLVNYKLQGSQSLPVFQGLSGLRINVYCSQFSQISLSHTHGQAGSVSLTVLVTVPQWTVLPIFAYMLLSNWIQYAVKLSLFDYVC